LPSWARRPASQPTQPGFTTCPDTTIHIGAEVRGVHARLGTNESEQLWPQLVATFPAYDLYQRNSKGRKLPMVILDPR
jgi:hypothetical protein